MLNPDDDEEFASTAWSLMANGAVTPPVLQAALRNAYPRAVVRRRELSGEPVEVWYVYRDGHWVRSIGRDADDRTGEG